MEQDEPDESDFVRRLSAVNERYEDLASGVLALYEAGDIAVPWDYTWSRSTPFRMCSRTR